MVSVGSQQKNDCVIVAIANGTNQPYDAVCKALNITSTINGIHESVYGPYLKSLGWYQRESIPRRGQDKISGIVLMIYTKHTTGHLVYINRGMVYDIAAPNGLPVSEYQRRYRRSHITEIWIAPAPKIVRSADDYSLDFLKLLV